MEDVGNQITNFCPRIKNSLNMLFEMVEWRQTYSDLQLEVVYYEFNTVKCYILNHVNAFSFKRYLR